MRMNKEKDKKIERWVRHAKSTKQSLILNFWAISLSFLFHSKIFTFNTLKYIFPEYFSTIAIIETFLLRKEILPQSWQSRYVWLFNISVLASLFKFSFVTIPSRCIFWLSRRFNDCRSESGDILTGGRMNINSIKLKMPNTEMMSERYRIDSFFMFLIRYTIKRKI